MKKLFFSAGLKHLLKILGLMAIFSFSLGMGNVSSVSASTTSAPASCGQMLAEAEARFRSTLAPDGSVPASPETKAAALEYIRVSKLCYEEIDSQTQASALQGETSSYIDDGGVVFGQEASSEFVLANKKWGSNTLGTPGGTVTYSFMGNGVDLSAENPNPGRNVAVSSLPGFKPCFITGIQTAFAAWQAVSDIAFVQVNDNGAAFNGSGATGDIRIGAHTFDGPSGTLAHTFYPPPNGESAAGDMHFDIAENWSCKSTGINIGIVALHEIGHALGLAHENTSTVAVMDPYYNSKLTSLQTDDINGALAIYGGSMAITAAAPPNDSIGTPTDISPFPYSQTLDTTGAADAGDGPPGQVTCEGKTINKGTKNVWYTFTTGTTTNVSFDTFGSQPAPGALIYDTYIAVWTSGLSLVGCNDDAGDLFQSQLVLRLNPGTYYVEVAQYNGDSPNNNVTPTGGTLNFHVIATGGGDTVGVFRPSNGIIYMKNQNTTGFADISINYGIPGDSPVVGDWDGNDTDTMGVYRNGRFYLRNSNTIGFADIEFAFGMPGDQPIAGDWNGDGVDTIGVYRSSSITFYLRNSNSTGPADIVYQLGIPGDVAIAGDWTNKGYDTVGVFRPSNGFIFLKDTHQTGFADTAINYGIGGDKPLAGDWDSNGTDTIGVLRGNVFYLRNSNTVGFADIEFALGINGDLPIAGNWNGIP